MSKKLFVGSLSWNTTDEGLRRAFEKFGEVLEAKVIKDRETDRSRGFGFVSFANPKDAMDAMAAMDGQELDGRTIKVNNVPVTIIGVAGRDFHGTSFSDPIQLFLPLTHTPRIQTGFFSRPAMLTTRNMSWVTVLLRLAPGVTPAAAASPSLGASHEN